MEIYYKLDPGEEGGPIDINELNTLYQSGRIKDDTLVRHDYLEKWTEFGKIKNAFIATQAPNKVTAAQKEPPVANHKVDERGAKDNPRQEVSDEPVEAQSTESKENTKIPADPEANITSRETEKKAAVETEAPEERPGFMRRVLAHVIDSSIYVAIFFVLILSLTKISEFTQPMHSFLNSQKQMTDLEGGFLIKTLGSMAPFLPLVCLVVIAKKYMATPGQMITGTQLVDQENQALTYSNTLFRLSILWWPILLFFLLNALNLNFIYGSLPVALIVILVWAATATFQLICSITYFTSGTRTCLHDRITKTMVVRIR